MKKNKTELVFLLDRSGSMRGLEKDTIGGYNSMLERQRKTPGRVNVTTVLFDHAVELLHDRADLRKVAPITDKEYYVRGSTALLDAIGSTICAVAAAHKSAPPKHRADNVLFVINTDGFENASREYTYDKIKKMIQYQKKHFGWEFIFLGANIDAVRTAANIGISADRAADYHADSAGTQLNYAVLSETIERVRSGKPLCADWKARIDRDYNNRRCGRRR